MASAAEYAANARRPASISKSTQPNAQMSVRVSTCCPRACSGLIYADVPRTTPRLVSSGVLATRGGRDERRTFGQWSFESGLKQRLDLEPARVAHRRAPPSSSPVSRALAAGDSRFAVDDQAFNGGRSAATLTPARSRRA